MTRRPTYLAGITALTLINSPAAELPELPLFSMQFRVRAGGMERVIGLLGKFATQAGYECTSNSSGITCGMSGAGYLMYSHLSEVNDLMINVYNQYDEDGRANPHVAKNASIVVQQMMSAVRKERSVAKACALPANFGVSFSCK